MRALSGQEQVVAALNERSVRARVRIDRTGSGTWVDLTNLEGRDWFDSAEYEDNVDNPVGEASFRLHRRWHDLSLSPLMAASKLNAGGTLVGAKRKIRIEAAVLPRGVQAAEADFKLWFSGRIDKIDWQKSPIEVRCRDKGGDLQDGWVEAQKVYGTGAGRAIELVIQDILTDAFTNEWIPEAVTLYSVSGTAGTPFAPADSPGFLILEYKQGREPIMDAIQKLARLIGWECRYRWNADTQDFQLTLYEPVRPVRARGTITVSGNPTAAQTFEINGITYTARASGAVTDEFNIVTGNTAATAQNISDMLNAGTGSADINAWRNGSTVIVEWQTPGAAGDAVTFTESMSNVTMDGGGTLGGTRAGVDAVPNHTFAPEGYWDVEQLSIDVKDVRNAFSGTFQDSSGNRVTVTRRNDESIGKYNRRPFILTEGASSQIDTVTEMVDLLDAADNDLSEPDMLQAVLVPYFPWGEAGDFYRFEANGEHYDSDQDLAAMSLRHTLSGDMSRTIITARGKPSLGPTRWLEAEGRPGVGPPPDIFTDEAAQNPAATVAVGMIVVTYDDPRTMDPPVSDWAYTECHVSTTNGFTPDTTTLKAIGRSTRFEIGDLVPGTTYYVKLKIIDSAGNVGVTSTQVSAATQRVGAYHENPDAARANLCPNGEFSQATLPIGSNPPDGWTLGGASSGSRTWGTDALEDTGQGQSGNRSVKFPSTGNDDTYAISDYIPVEEGRFYRVAALFRAGANAGGQRPNIRIIGYDKDKAEVFRRTLLLLSPLTATNTWQVYEVDLWAHDDGSPTTTWARFIKVMVGKNLTGGASDFDLWCDSVHVVRGHQAFRVYRSASQAIITATPTVVQCDVDEFDIGATGVDTVGYGLLEGATCKFRVLEPGRYKFECQFGIDDLGDGKRCEVGFNINGAQATRGQSVPQGAAGDAWAVASAIFDLDKGDYVEAYVYHDHGANRNVLAGSVESWFSGSRVQS